MLDTNGARTPLGSAVTDQRCALLIVEDDETLQDLIRTILTRHATSIDTASDGEQAIEMLQRNSYDIVILDLMLPKKNGLLVAETVAALANKPRLIVLSGISRYLSDRLPAGALVLQKPFEIDKLAETVRGIRAELQASSSTR
jgi:DNA-binding response OmpR family regulator